MSLVLAVEPDGKQAEFLRGLIGQQAGTQLIVVTSAYAAAVLMNRRVPDLVLLGASLDQKAREHVVDHFILASPAPEPQTLGIPLLRGADHDTAFGAAIAAGLARATGQGQAQDDEIPIDLDSSQPGEAPADAEAHAAQLAMVQAQAEARLASELERVRSEAAEQRAAELTRLQAEAEAQLRAEVGEARTAAAVDARNALAAELADARREADQTLASELARVRDAHAAAEAEAARALEAEVERVRAEAERRRVTELAVISAELDQMRDAAREQAYSAATQAVSAEVARAEISIPRAVAQMAAHARSQTVSATAAAVSMTIRRIGRGGSAALPVARRLVRGVSRRTIAAVAALLLVTGGLAFVDVWSLTRRGTSVARSASGRAATTLGHAAQAAQTTLTSAARALLTSDNASDAAARPAPAGAETPLVPTTAPESTAAGLLAVFSRVSLDLYISGRRIGTTDDGQIVLKPGRYRVGLVNRQLNYRDEITLDIRPGAVTAHNVSLPNGLLQLETEPGAEIWIEGERAGVAPLAAVLLPIGTREVVVRHPDLNERRAFVEVRYGGVTPMSIPLREVIRPPGEAFPLPSLAPRQ